jgi:hypothetical protein
MKFVCYFLSRVSLDSRLRGNDKHTCIQSFLRSLSPTQIGEQESRKEHSPPNELHVGAHKLGL